MKSSIRIIAASLSAAAFLSAAPWANAELTAAEAARLGKDLTPFGAEKAGNKEGTIPEWTGGMTSPPAGWKPEMGYIDPFEDEKPLFVITAANMDQYKDKLSPGLQGMLKKYPTFNVPVYKSHRTYAASQKYYDDTMANAAKVKLTGEQTLTNFDYATFRPFPIPKTGAEAIVTHKSWNMGGGYNRCGDWLPTRALANGEYYRVGFCEEVYSGSNFDVKQPNNIFSYYGWYDAPATLIGTIYLVRDPLDYSVKNREAWIYNAGQRRVRRAPDVAFDNQDDGTEGMRTTDDWWGFHGSLERYDWKLIGKKEMYIPYNAYKLNSSKLKYKDMVQKGHLKSDLFRYELHRVWHVEATLKAGSSHVIAKRVFFLDEDSGMAVLVDGYDSRGNLWRVYLEPHMQAYEAKVMFQSPYIVHDLSNGNFIASMLINERKAPVYKWGAMGKWADFQIDAIRRRGSR